MIEARTCEELEACCAVLEGELKMQCDTTVEGAADVEDEELANMVCSGALQGFGVLSDAPECD